MTSGSSVFLPYTKEILTRLYQTNKYEIRQLGIYGRSNDDRRYEVPWPIYGNYPDTPEEEREYGPNYLNQFGCWRFEDVCLDFQPDIVVSISDQWMCEFIERSPFRKYFENLLFVMSIIEYIILPLILLFIFL